MRTQEVSKGRCKLELEVIKSSGPFYNIFYKNIEAKISDILRINPRLRIWKEDIIFCVKKMVKTKKLCFF